MDQPVENPYGTAAVGSKYQGQDEPTPSRYYRNFESK
jgi:dCTP deaminase